MIHVLFSNKDTVKLHHQQVNVPAGCECIVEENVSDLIPEPNCTVQSASISVTSTCATSFVGGVVIRGQNVIDVTSSALGLYQMKVCSQPMIVTMERNGYASQEATISDGSTVTLLCGKPWAFYEPHTVHLMHRTTYVQIRGAIKKSVHYYHNLKMT